MEKFKELSLEESVNITGGNIWRWAKVVYEALQIQDAVNEFVDGWNSVDC